MISLDNKEFKNLVDLLKNELEKRTSEKVQKKEIAVVLKDRLNDLGIYQNSHKTVLYNKKSGAYCELLYLIDCNLRKSFGLQ